jgi:hypothetical protein
VPAAPALPPGPAVPAVLTAVAGWRRLGETLWRPPAGAQAEQTCCCCCSLLLLLPLVPPMPVLLWCPEVSPLLLRLLRACQHWVA